MSTPLVLAATPLVLTVHLVERQRRPSVSGTEAKGARYPKIISAYGQDLPIGMDRSCTHPIVRPQH
jgi:hypothetical protein